jgi:hypothetical protein
MTTSSIRRPTGTRVLIVEPDADLAMALVRECSRLGLEPKLCRGPRLTSSCPALEGDRCERPEHVEATLVSVTDAIERKAAPVCGGGRVVVAGDRPLVGPHTIGAIGADVVVSYPYDPREVAAILLAQVTGAREEAVRGLVSLEPGIA